MEFIQRFNKLYNKILAEVKPSQPTTKVTFTEAFEPDFALFLTERQGATLTQMQDDVVEIESNMMASGKLKSRIETGNRETRHFREQAGPLGSNRSTDDKMDDMARVIKELSNKISRMWLDKSKSDPFVKREFRRNPNPQNQQRQVKNEDQKIQTPLKNENFIGGNDLEYFEGLEEDVTNLGDDCTQPYVTKEDYEKLLNTPQPSNEEDDINNNDFVVCQEMSNSMIVGVQARYNLRSKNKPTSIPQSKKIFPRGEIYVPAPKDTETYNNKTKEADLWNLKTKGVETQTKEIKTTETPSLVSKLMSNKSTQTNKLEKKEL
jgi:hypothetical protein